MRARTIRKVPQAPARRLPPVLRIGEALARLGRAQAIQTLVRGALPVATLRRLLKDALPQRAAKELPTEIWAGLACGIALESPVFGIPLAQALHDRVGWDRDPPSMDDWWRLVRERPLEALWMAALTEDKAVRKEFAHIAEHCVDNFRASPECVPPSWEFIDSLIDTHRKTMAELKEAEKKADDAERRSETERERLDEVRDELKRLRRENAELRGERALAERKAQALSVELKSHVPADESKRAEESEKRLRKAEKEREHLWRELERLKQSAAAANPTASAREAEPELDDDGDSASVSGALRPPLSEDPNPRRRVLRQMLRKLFKKGKIGASHTHEDNVYRGVADHEKGIAKEAMDLLYREGLLVPKPTVTDPHVSLRPDRIAEVRSIIAGEVANPRLQRFVES